MGPAMSESILAARENEFFRFHGPFIWKSKSRAMIKLGLVIPRAENITYFKQPDYRELGPPRGGRIGSRLATTPATFPGHGAFILFASVFRFGVSCAVLLAIAGCGAEDEGDGLIREAVSGTVTLGGEPLDEASIHFIPTNPGAPGESSGEINGGKFSIPKERGPVAGGYTVKISSIQNVEVDPDLPPGPPPKPKPERIPKKYNAASTLNAEIKAGEPNELTFDLDAK